MTQIQKQIRTFIKSRFDDLAMNKKQWSEWSGIHYDSLWRYLSSDADRNLPDQEEIAALVKEMRKRGAIDSASERILLGKLKAIISSSH